MKRLGRARDFLCLLLIGAAAAALLWRPLFLDEAFVGADHLQFQYPWGLEAPAEPKLHNLDVSDGLQQFYPYRLRLHRALRENRLPLWNPDSLCGTPFQGIDYSSIFYPLNAVAYKFMHPAIALGWMAFLHAWLAGAGAFLFLRLLRASRAGALIGAFSWMFSSFLVCWMQFPPMHECLSWLPMLLCLLEIALRRGGAGRFALLGAAWGAQITAGYLQGSIYIALAMAGWAIWRAVAARRPVLLAKAGLSAALAAALSSPHWIPVLELAGLSHREAATAHGWHVDGFPSLQLLTALAPNLFGSPLTQNYSGAKNFTELAFYVGTAALFLTLAGFAGRLGGKYGGFFKWMIAAALLCATGSPLYLPLYYGIPFFKAVSAHRATSMAGFGMAMLAGLVWTQLEASLRGSKGRSAGRVGAIWAAGIMLAATAFMALAAQPLFGKTAGELFKPIGGDLLRAGAMTAILAAAFLGLYRNAAIRGAIVALAALEMLSWATPYNPSVPTANVYPPNPAISFIQKQPSVFRAMGLSMGGDWVFYPNSAGVYGLQDVRGYDSLFMRRYKELIDAIQEKYSNLRFPKTNVLDLTAIRAPILDFMNLDYVMSPEPFDAFDWEPEYTDGIYIYKNKRVLDRVVAVGRFYNMPDDNALLEAVVSPHFNPQEEAYLEKEAAPVMDKFAKIAASGEPTDAAFLSDIYLNEYKGDFFAVEATFSRPGLLVFSESHHPGWRATVDGMPAPVLRANYQFMSVPLDAGRHQVELAFRPGKTIKALDVALAGLVLAFVCLPIGLLKKSQRKIRSGSPY